MKRVLLTRILVLLLVVCSSGIENQKMAVGSTPQVSLTKREYLILPEEEYLKLQDDEIDIAVGSLIIAKRIYPDIDIQKYLNQIDAMAKELEPKLKTCKNHSEIVKTISRYLFVEQKLKYDEDKDFINNVLDEKRGQCLSLSYLYLSITERLQLPFYGVNLPKHMFVRYDDGRVKINIETTAGGEIRTEEKILEGQGLGVSYLLETTKDGIYLKNLTKRQLLFICLGLRGTIYSDKGDFDKAIVDLNKVIDLYPKYYLAYFNRGKAFKGKGDFDKAIVDYNKLIDLDPKYADAYFSRGNAYHGKGDFDKAIQDFTKVISIDPKFTDAYINRGIALGTKGDYDKAIQDFNKAISVDPKNASAYNNRGTTYKRKGDIDKAIVDYNKAIDLDPKYADAYFNRAGALMTKGDFDKALPDFSRAIAINPELPSLYFLRAVIYFSKGDKKNALQDLKKAVELDPRIKNSVKKVFGESKEYAEDEEFKKIIK